MDQINPFKEATDIVIEAGGQDIKSCYQCGLCTGNCPWNLVRSFLTRRLIHQAQLGLADLEGEDIWLCATCGACVERCPRGVEVIDIMRALRRTIVGVGAGSVPDSLRITMKNIAGVGNPQGEEPEKRADWAKDLDVKTFTTGTELLYFPCCIPVYDPKVRRVAQASINVLNNMGADFGILGTRESCCGESIRKAGNESLFRSLTDSNIGAFVESGVEKILVTSPHCYHTFKNEYPELGGNFEVIHFTQYLCGLIDEGKIKFTKQLKKRVAYHDPCYLGRHNNIYDEPRKVLTSIPGLELFELPDSRQDSICCGGGGGRIWMETKKGERFSDLRLEQAVEVGADILAVACPYCLLNFEDSMLTQEQGKTIEVKDISELVNEAI
jgi:Fe-S oxidoreductase